MGQPSKSVKQCGTCDFFEGYQAKNNLSEYGSCWFEPPKLLFCQETKLITSEVPTVRIWNRCSHWRPREEIGIK